LSDGDGALEATASEHCAPALLVRELRKSYGRRTALHGVDMTVGRGELVGLLGPNGAGKSTLVKTVCGLVRATTGTVRVFGDRAGTRASRKHLGYLAELFRYPAWCTGEELLQLHQRLAGADDDAVERRRLLELVGLGDAARVRVEAMSKGMQQRLGLAQALVGDPRLLLLDEPTSALDPAGRRLVREVLSSLQARGVSVLLNSHLLSEVELVCDRVVILSRGRVVAEGAPAGLSRARGVEVETDRGTRVVDGGRDDVPRIVAELVAAGEQIYSVQPVRSTLEEVYLEAVEGHAS